jgi:pimeloyl-ACP methyl ester carboxylesterase
MRFSALRFAALGLLLFGSAGLVSSQGALQTRQLKVNGADISYVDQGSGTAVVFVHGAVADLRFWEPQRQEISKRHRFVSYTLRYHGIDPWTDSGQQYSTATHAADLAAFIEGLKAGPVHLVGLSYGGLLAGMVALDHPKLIRTLTVAEPAFFSLLAETPEGKPALDAWLKAAAPVMAALKSGDTAGATKQLAAVVTGKGPETFQELPAAFRQILTDNSRTLPLLFAAPAEAVPCEKLKAAKAPTLVIGGAESPVFFAKMNELTVKCIPGSRLEVIPKASHTMSLDNPADFNRRVLRFFEKH